MVFNFYHQDELGSVVRITDINGNVVNSYDYDDYGNIISQTENITNDYTYTGKERDKDSGLYYYGARYYDPEIGRWLTKDLNQNMLPAMRHLRNAQKLSRYSYVLNNPMTLIDIWGLEGVPTAGVGGAGSTSGSGSAGSTPPGLAVRPESVATVLGRTMAKETGRRMVMLTMAMNRIPTRRGREICSRRFKLV